MPLIKIWGKLRCKRFVKITTGAEKNEPCKWCKKRAELKLDEELKLEL